MVRGRARRLDDEDVLAADILIDFHRSLPVWEGVHLNVCQRLAKGFRNFSGKLAMGGSTDDFHGQRDC